MLLREHDKLRWAGSSIWPPYLVGSYTDGEPFCSIEHAVLKEVRHFEVKPGRKPYLMLEFECGARRCWGAVNLDDPNYLRPLYEWLKEQADKTIPEIGEGEVSF